MSELVDQFVGEGTPAAPEPATPNLQAGDGAIGGEQPGVDAELKKHQSMSYRYRRQLEEARNENQALQERMARIEGRLEGTGGAEHQPAVPRSLDEFTSAQLEESLQNASSQGNQDLANILLDEKMRRTSRGEAEKIREDTLRQVEQERYKASVLGNLHQRFFDGQQPDPESPLLRHAEQEYNGMLSQWGEKAKAYPEFQELALRRADDVLTGHATRQSLEQKDTEIRELRSQLARLESGANAGMTRDPEAHELLAKGDIKGGLRKVAGNLFGAPRP